MKIAAMILLFLLAILLQTTVFSALPLWGAYPDLLTVLVVNLGILNGRDEGAWLGFGAGLLRDLLVGRFIGLNAAALALVGFISGTAAQRLYRDNYIVPLFFAMLGTWFGRSLVLVGMALFGKMVPWNLQIVRVIFFSGLYSALITAIIYRRFVRFNERIIYWDELVRRAG